MPSKGTMNMSVVIAAKAINKAKLTELPSDPGQ
jgi:hypothetical protein